MFVSFASENRGTAESALQALESNGYSCWVAWRDIPEGVPYAAAIVQGIRAARVLVVLLTPESRVSPHVLREVECAVAANRPILSVQMEGCLPGEALAYYLGPTEWLRNEQTELDGGRLVAAVGKIAKDARAADTEHVAKRNWPVLFRSLLRFPVGILVVTGLVLAAVTGVIGQFLPQDELGGLTVVALQNRSILLIVMGCWLVLGFAAEDAIERRRAPFNPLRGRAVSSWAVIAGSLLILGLWIWTLATGFSPKVIFWNDDGINGIPDFLLGTGDTTSFWWKLRTALSGKGYAWNLGLSPLIALLATGMVLGSVAFCVVRLVRSAALSTGVLAMLPFLVVRCAMYGEHGNNAPPLVYWCGPLVAGLLALGLHFGIRSLWPKAIADRKLEGIAH